MSRAGVLSVLFLFSLLKEISNLSHYELMRFQGRKKINTWFPLNCICGKESEAHAEKKYFFSDLQIFVEIFLLKATPFHQEI